MSLSAGAVLIAPFIVRDIIRFVKCRWSTECGPTYVPTLADALLELLLFGTLLYSLIVAVRLVRWRGVGGHG